LTAVIGHLIQGIAGFIFGAMDGVVGLVINHRNAVLLPPLRELLRQGIDANRGVIIVGWIKTHRIDRLRNRVEQQDRILRPCGRV